VRNVVRKAVSLLMNSWDNHVRAWHLAMIVHIKRLASCYDRTHQT